MLNQSNRFYTRVVLFLGFILLLSACEGRPKGVLNKSDMTKVLVDMHKAEAVLAEKGLSYGLYSNKAPYYKYILKKYGITQAEFDSSLVWYTKHPKNFTLVYADVVEDLTDYQKEIKNGKYHPVDTMSYRIIKNNVWNQRIKYVLTKDSARTRLAFLIPTQGFMYKDVYVLRFLQRIAPEDSSVRQRIVLRINYWNGKTDSVSKMAYHDSILRRYTFRFPAIRKYKIKSVSGELLSSTAYKGKLNAFVDSISLIRQFDYVMQDSLRRMVEKADPKNYEVNGNPAQPLPGHRVIRPNHKILPQ